MAIVRTVNATTLQKSNDIFRQWRKSTRAISRGVTVESFFVFRGGRS